MIQIRYRDPADDSIVADRLASEEDLPGLLGVVIGVSGGRGHPALEPVRPGGSSLTIATDGSRCALVLVNTIGESFHSVGGAPGPALIFDYLGSWSEVPAQFTAATGDRRSRWPRGQA